MIKRKDIAEIGIDGNFSDYMKSVGEVESWDLCWSIEQWLRDTRKNHRSYIRLENAFARAVECYESTFGQKLVPF